MSDLDDSVVGLKKELMQKVSSFRTRVNVSLVESNKTQSLQTNEAVKYLRATKFDITKAEELFWNYQSNVDFYNLLQVTKSQSQLLNAEIRTRKLEVLGTRDKTGALLLVYTAARHTPKSHDSHNAIQLFFLILGQISDSHENQSKGVTFIFDMRDAQSSSFNGAYADAIFSILLNGYPIYVSMIYIVDAPSWFKAHHKIQAYTTLKQLGKIKHCSASDLMTHLPASSVPQSFGGSFVTGMTSFVPSSEALTHSLSPTHSFPAHSVIPPPRKNKPVLRQSSDVEDDSAEEQPLQGSVNKMKELLTTSFESQVQNGKSSNKTSPVVAGRQKPSKVNGSNNPGPVHLKNPKPLPPPKLNHSTSNDSSPIRVRPKIPLLPTKKREGNQRIAKASSSDDVFKQKEDSKPVLVKQSPLLGRNSGKIIPLTTPITSSSAHNVPKDNDAKKATKHLVTINLKGSSNQPDKVATPPPSYDPPSFPDTDNQKPPHSQSKLKKTQVSNPPPLYTPPSPPSDDNSDSKPTPKARYVNVNVTKLVESTTSNTKEQPPQQQQPHKAAPYKVTAIPKSEPPTATSIPPPTNNTVKLREPITHVPELPRKEPATETKKNRPNCYENVFFTKETLHEDEGSCFDGGDDEAIYENFGPDEGNRWMTVDELEQYVTRKGKQGLSAEYYKIKNDPLFGSADTFRLPCNTSKNRYKDVVCYDSSRVILNKINDIEGSDYIHANYVNGFEKKQAYILTQGPLKRTTADYWRMLWEKEVFVIVMTTKCVEMAKLKCAQYWPDEGKPSATFGNITVSVVEHELKGSFEFRKLSVHCDGQTRVLIHYQFIAWPDYGVPETGKQIFDLLDEARRTQEQFSEYVEDPLKFPLYGPPLVIHCSAGIGRSGTFMALDYSIDELRVKGRVNLQHCVRLLRQQRAFAIQTDEQYRFCYTTLLEYGKYLKQVLKL